MAKLIKPDGTEQEVKPQNGTELTLEEMRACVEGHFEAIPFISPLVMYINEEGALTGLPHNNRATQLLKMAQPTRVHTDIYGNALIASLQETGDMPNVLHVQTVPVNLPCDECHSENYPNLQWNLYGMKGVFCRDCMAKEVDNVNHTINDKPW